MKREKILHKITETLAKCIEVDLVYALGSFLERDDFNSFKVSAPYERFEFAMRISREIERGMKLGCGELSDSLWKF